LCSGNLKIDKDDIALKEAEEEFEIESEKIVVKVSEKVNPE